MIKVCKTNTNKTRTQKIALNTMILFIRMFVITIINLYTVRLVLQGLGQEDYGIFNAVAGVVTTTSFISSILELSIQRFYSVALAKNSHDELVAIFSISLNIICVLSLIILLLFETGGLWFISDMLTIPTERMNASIYCFQFSLIAFLLSIIQIPFSAAIFAHEAMNVYAIISSVDCMLKLLVAVAIGMLAYDNLSFYSFGLFVVACITFLLYSIYAHKKYPECRYKRVSNNLLTKQILSFSGWTMFGSVAKVFMIQGSTIVLNIFFGPITNAAFAISLQINNAFNALSNSMILAIRPAMIKAYTEQAQDYLYKLFTVSNKFLLYILLLISIPIIGNMDTIIQLWLKNSTFEIVCFGQLCVIYIIVLAMNNPITIIIQASGNIKTYFVTVESISLLCLPAAYIAFKLGFPSYYIYVTMIIVCIMAHFMRLICLKKTFEPFKYRDYFIGLCMPALYIGGIGCGIELCITQLIANNYIHLFISIFVTPILMFITIYLVGITREEKIIINSFIKQKIRK